MKNKSSVKKAKPKTKANGNGKKFDPPEEKTYYRIVDKDGCPRAGIYLKENDMDDVDLVFTDKNGVEIDKMTLGHDYPVVGFFLLALDPSRKCAPEL